MKLNKILAQLVIILSIFCYIKFFNLGTNTDIQLYYFILGILYLLIRIFEKKQINKKLLYNLLYLILVILTFYIISKDIAEISRGAFGYISFLMMPWVYYLCIIDLGEIKIEKILKKSFFIWNFVGIIQLLNNNLLTFWRNRSTIGGGRGSISFATEPAYFILTLLMIVICLIQIKFEYRKYLIYVLFSSLILAKSAVGLLYTILIILIYYFDYIKKNKLKVIILTGVIITILVNYLLIVSDSRMSQVFFKLLKNPLGSLKEDGSLRTRIIHIIYPIRRLKEVYLLPSGVNTFNENLKKDFELIKFLYPENYQLPFNVRGESKLVSLHGALLYELGFLSSYIYLLLIRMINFKENKRELIIILLLGINGLNITNPLLSLFLICLYYKKRKVNRNFNLRRGKYDRKKIL